MKRATFSYDSGRPGRPGRPHDGALCSAFVALLTLVGCSCSCPERREQRPREKSQQDARPRSLRAYGLYQIIFTTPARVEGAREGWLGCQLHLIDSNGKLEVGVDLGDARRRAFYRKTDAYARRPAFFPFGGGAGGPLTVELHSLTHPPIRAAAKLGAPTTHRHLGKVSLPWPFSCFLRGEHGAGVAVDGIIHSRWPKLAGSRRLEPADARPKKEKAFLRRLLGR